MVSTFWVPTGSLTRFLLESNRKLIHSPEKALAVAEKTAHQKIGVWKARAILSVEAELWVTHDAGQTWDDKTETVHPPVIARNAGQFTIFRGFEI
jgi:hypothetical protein